MTSCLFFLIFMVYFKLSHFIIYWRPLLTYFKFKIGLTNRLVFLLVLNKNFVKGWKGETKYHFKNFLFNRSSAFIILILSWLYHTHTSTYPFHFYCNNPKCSLERERVSVGERYFWWDTYPGYLRCPWKYDVSVTFR